MSTKARISKLEAVMAGYISMELLETTLQEYANAVVRQVVKHIPDPTVREAFLAEFRAELGEMKF